MNNLMEEVIGEVQVELDGRFSSMRTKETNLGELPVDALLFGETTRLFHLQTLTFNFLHSYRTHLPLDAVRINSFKCGDFWHLYKGYFCFQILYFQIKIIMANHM